MPEIGEVARIVHYLKKHVVGKTVSAVKVQEDEIIYGKAGTTASAFQKAMTGKRILDARQQGKYFWMVMDSPPHPLMHFGMSGWMKFSNDNTAYYKPAKVEEEQWPPKFWKFVLEMDGEEKCEVAFIDPRRLGRIRLVDAEAEDMRKTTPLKENGPDPVIDKDILTQEWLTRKLRSKKVPVKALLLDQANISGVGNWVGDEVLYQAKIHPEQYSNTFDDEQIKRLHDSLVEVCTTAVETLAESDKFPEDWLMKHRWGKGKKDKDRLPNGDKIVFLKVGGRTSAVVPSVQKKTAAVAADIPEDSEANGSSTKTPKGTSKAKKSAEDEEEYDAARELPASKPAKRGRKSTKVEDEVKDEEDEDEEAPKKKSKTTRTAKAASAKAPTTVKGDDSGRRRSARIYRA